MLIVCPLTQDGRDHIGRRVGVGHAAFGVAAGNLALAHPANVGVDVAVYVVAVAVTRHTLFAAVVGVGVLFGDLGHGLLLGLLVSVIAYHDSIIYTHKQVSSILCVYFKLSAKCGLTHHSSGTGKKPPAPEFRRWASLIRFTYQKQE